MIDRRKINLDITTRCTLACPECRRTIYKNLGWHIHGQDMPFEDFVKVCNFFDGLEFCGGVSDPVFHPKFIEFLNYCKNKVVTVHNAASHKSMDWYVKAFNANPNATWYFGLDGLPEESHKYRVNQDGVKLFEVMKMAVDMGMNVVWQYLVFDYNKDHIKEAKSLSKGMTFLTREPRTFKSGPT
tara:strand:- start:2088 stop:2639 length:552 start_codon:yes stop_codon:yes gene_type:complete